jgi:hypothetical protein
MFVERWLNNDEDLVASAGLCSTQRTKREDGRDQRAYGNHETVCALFCVFVGIMGDTGVDTSFGRMLSFDLTCWLAAAHFVHGLLLCSVCLQSYYML